MCPTRYPANSKLLEYIYRISSRLHTIYVALFYRGLCGGWDVSLKVEKLQNRSSSRFFKAQFMLLKSNRNSSICTRAYAEQSSQTAIPQKKFGSEYTAQSLLATSQTLLINSETNLQTKRSVYWAGIILSFIYSYQSWAPGKRIPKRRYSEYWCSWFRI